MTARRSAAAVLAGACMLAACSSEKPKPAPTSASTYHTKATLSVTTTGDPSADAATIAQLATSAPALRSVINNLHLSLSVDELKTHLSAGVTGSSQARIVAEDIDPTRAAELANADAN